MTRAHETNADTTAGLRATFVMEQHLGHRTFYENLRTFVDGDIAAHWVEVTYRGDERWTRRVPFVDDRITGALNGRVEVRAGCRHDAATVRFFNTQVPAMLGGRLVRSCPYVLCTDVTPVQYDSLADRYGHRPDGRGPVARYKHRLNGRVLAAATRHVAWSRWVRDSLVDDYGVDARRVAVIPPGVDTARWTVGDVGDAGPVRILFVGGDFHRKGGGHLLDAFAALPPGTAELAIVTRTALTSGPGVRVHTGLSPNSDALISLFRSSDVFVMPSDGETFGIAAVEAAASGLPVIATRVGGFVDIVADGETGFLVAPGDTRALTARLSGLVADRSLRQRLGAGGRRRAEQRFDARTNAGRIAAVLRDAAAEGPVTSAAPQRRTQGTSQRRRPPLAHEGASLNTM